MSILSSPGTLSAEDVRLMRAMEAAGEEARRSVETADDLSKVVCVCGKKREILDCGWLQTGQYRITNNLCPDCEQSSRECARFICVRCQRVIGFVTPHRTPDGFVVGKGAYLHVLGGCTICTMFPEDKGGRGTIAEKLLFNRRKGFRE